MSTQAARSVKRPPSSSVASASTSSSSAAGAIARFSSLIKSQPEIRPPINERRKIEIAAAKRSTDVKMKSPVLKSEVTQNTGPSTSKSAAKSTPTKARVKENKVFTLAGQKYDPPEEREPLRIFYESLSQQIPTSEMAEFWMMEHGLLSPERSRKALERKQRNQKQIRMGTPIKSPNPPSKPESSQRQQQATRSLANGDIKAKKKIANNSDDEEEFILNPKRRKV